MSPDGYSVALEGCVKRLIPILDFFMGFLLHNDPIARSCRELKSVNDAIDTVNPVTV